MPKKVIVTIDTESHEGINPVEHLIWGKTSDGKLCGIPLIMDICDEFNVKAVFFVDMAEIWDYGEEKIAEVLHEIVKRGHDVGVHIHPDHMCDSKRLFLWEYSYDEQRDIILRCTDAYTKILGKKPLVFRAGKYGANYDTLKILGEEGNLADFSEFFGNKWCGITPPITGNTSVQLESGLVEVPTMSYESHFPGLFRRNDKLDTSMPYCEYKYILQKLINDEQTNIIVFFIHSFSLLKWRLNPDNPREDVNERNKLRKMLSDINGNKDLDFVSLSELLNANYPTVKREEDVKVFSIPVMPSLIFMVMRAWRYIIMHSEIFLCNHITLRKSKSFNKEK